MEPGFFLLGWAKALRDAVASCKRISGIKGRKDEELFKLMNGVGIRTNGAELGIRRCLITIRVTRCHSSLHTGVMEQNRAHRTALKQELAEAMKEVI